MKKILFVMSLLLIVGLPVHAAMSSESYVIIIPTISSGGSASMESGSYRMMDIKGQTVIGTSSSGAYSVDLGGVYGEAGEGVEGTGEAFAPNGTVPLYISRSGSDIKLTWEASSPNPQIFMMTGDGSGQYKNDNTSTIIYWTQVTSSTPGFDFTRYSLNEILHNGQVGAGSPEAYYKALKAGVSPTATNTTIPTMTNLGAAWAVGKVNVELGQNTYKLVNIPLVMPGKTFGNEMALLMPDGTIQYKDLSNILKQASFAGGITDSPAEPILISNGFWFKSEDARTVTFVGDVKHDAFSRALADRYNLFGFPFPRLVNVNAGELGITPVTGDTMQSQDDRGILLQYSYGGTSWDSTIQLKAPRGFWYFNNSTGARTFQANP